MSDEIIEGIRMAVEVKQKDGKELIDQSKKVKFKVSIDFLDHTEYLEYETTEAGLRHFNIF